MHEGDDERRPGLADDHEDGCTDDRPDAEGGEIERADPLRRLVPSAVLEELLGGLGGKRLLRAAVAIVRLVTRKTV